MSRQEQQRIRNAMWQVRWQECEGSGVTMAEYARREGFDAQNAYRWRRFSRLSGRWSDAVGGGRKLHTFGGLKLHTR